jgi:hypothetical protein
MTVILAQVEARRVQSQFGLCIETPCQQNKKRKNRKQRGKEKLLITCGINPCLWNGDRHIYLGRNLHNSFIVVGF